LAPDRITVPPVAARLPEPPRIAVTTAFCRPAEVPSVSVPDPRTEPPATDRLERSLGKILAAGVLASTGLLAAGLLLQLVGVGLGTAAALTNAGLIVLMATPVARVAVSVIEYSLERDWLFAMLTTTVLIILLGSLVVSMQG